MRCMYFTLPSVYYYRTVFLELFKYVMPNVPTDALRSALLTNNTKMMYAAQLAVNIHNGPAMMLEEPSAAVS